MIYKTFQKVSNVCQVLDKSKYYKTQTINGVTFTNNEDGTITVNGTATNDAYYTIIPLRDTLYLSHKYLLTGQNPGLYLFVENRDKDNKLLPQLKYNIIRSLPTNTKKSTFECYIEAGTVCDNLVIKPQLFDLTEMYGAGNEPTTVAQFRKDFPEEMYDYSPYCFVKSYRTLLKVSNVCQLLDKRKFLAAQTINGVTFTNNGDGTITVNGTATSGIFYWVKRFIDNSLCLSHKYLVTGETSGLTFFMENRDENNKILTQVNYNMISALPSNTKRSTFECYIKQGKVCDNLVIKPQLFDLTEMYGAGNEPTTVAQFRQDFPNELYDYKPYSIIPSYKKSLMCKTKNLFDIPLIQGYPSNTNFDNSTKRTFTIGTYIVGLTRNNYYDKSYIKTVNVSKNRISFKLIGPWFGVSIPCLLTVGKTYTFSCKTDKNYSTNIGISYYKENGELISYTDDSGNNHKIVKSFTVPENTYYTLILFTGAHSEEYSYYDIQLELGDTATDYVPYGHL